MPILADFHMHSSFSGDSQTPMDEMILGGIAKGLRYMCFTEHMDFDLPVTANCYKDMFTVDMPGYLAAFSHCREEFSGRMELGWGIELGLQPHVAEKNRAFVKAHDFDFVIGSVHCCSGIDPAEPEFFQGRSEYAAYSEYLKTIVDNIHTFDDYDVFGHLDYVLRYSPNRDKNFSYADYADYYEEILKALISRGKGIELNTGGLMKGLKEPHPCVQAIRRYRQLGGEIITVGSDAHTANNVAGGFGRAAEVLEHCGFKYYTVFRGRKPRWLAIGEG